MLQRTDTKFSAKTKPAEKARFFGQFGFAAPLFGLHYEHIILLLQLLQQY
jgi:hypothetical protein